MKKIYIICLTALLAFTGCKKSSGNETESSISDMQISAENISEEMTETQKKSEEKISETTKNKTDKKISEIQTTEKNIPEMPVITYDIQEESKAVTVTDLAEKTEIQTEIYQENNDNILEETTTATTEIYSKNKVVEMPFVPAE